jgi:hypothetical protein
MRLYIAGPMTGYVDYNFPAFQRAARVLVSLGFDVLNPAEKESTAEGKPELSLIPKKWGGDNTYITPGAIREKDIRDLLFCDGVVLLEGWMESWGALLEAAVAQVCEKKLFTMIFHPANGWSLSPLVDQWVIRAQLDWIEEGHKDAGNTDRPVLLETYSG